ncbi:hypothetical protein BN874_360007 [Candidatus Contendobacter odensis Run_B_J11]|uniref:Uncharacterized protein n=1 Tax=Candidatus Contendobacter odensis Run_B_J11 TaxID=1400861 RepID=A0A7U7GE28_9GAMM|nr:hypothetical protein BN874_360007 [Candidatus Contendobacter odensis Run_B_J11]
MVPTASGIAALIKNTFANEFLKMFIHSLAADIEFFSRNTRDIRRMFLHTLKNESPYSFAAHLYPSHRKTPHIDNFIKDYCQL